MNVDKMRVALVYYIFLSSINFDYSLPTYCFNST